MNPIQNTDKELYRETPSDPFSNSLHATKDGGIGINVGGHVIVQPLSVWHAKTKLFNSLIDRIQDLSWWRMALLRIALNTRK